MQITLKYIPKALVAMMILLLSAAFQLHAQWDKDVFSYRGRKALQEGKYATAIENFNILARLDTTDYWNYFFRGIAKYNLGDLHGAQADFNTSVRLNPVFTNGYHYRAIISSRMGNYDAAFADFERALELRPGSESIYYSRGVTYFMSQQFENAVADFNRYLRKVPKDPSAYLNRGAAKLFLADTTSALEDYNKAIKLDRFDPEGYVRRGRLFASMGNLELGVQDLDKALEYDHDNTFALFNRALMLNELHRYSEAMADFDAVLALEPGNALTLYNRGLVRCQLGDYEGALDDLDRVSAINPNNVLVYFNRASIFIQTGHYQDALEDYDRAIALYPDFAKAYLNRSYVKNLLGRNKSSRDDYNIAQRKIREYRDKNMENAGSFADTTRKYNSLLALDADFAKRDFNDELNQHRDVDVNLRPLYKFVRTDEQTQTHVLARRYENVLVDRFVGTTDVAVAVKAGVTPSGKLPDDAAASSIAGARASFLRALGDYDQKRFGAALAMYDQAVELSGREGGDEAVYKAFYLMNRAVLRAEMIEFIASIDNNLQVLSMDDKGNTRARVKDRATQTYDYSEALADMERAAVLAPSVAYVQFNLGNLYCLSGDHIAAINAYTKAIKSYPYMGDAYFNRALVQIYLKDKEKGCSDLSVAGELGVKDAYSIIHKYCK